MKNHQFIHLKRLKDKDTAEHSRFYLSMAWALPFLFCVGVIYGYLLGGIQGVIIGIIICTILSVIASLVTMFVSHKLGEFASFLYRGPKPNWSIQEQFEGALNQVRYHKMNKRFDQALMKVEEILAKAPYFSDALLLKASILWDGFDEPIEAKRCLEAILKTTQKPDPFHPWASTLYADIVKEEKKRLKLKQEDSKLKEH